jgi:hypothetical protein
MFLVLDPSSNARKKARVLLSNMIQLLKLSIDQILIMIISNFIVI